MKTFDYLIQYHDIKSFSIAALKELLLQKRGIPLSELKVLDLAFYKGEPIYSGNGVYIFKTKDRVIYVGDCIARNFVERIPGHFDLRPGGWFNSLLKSVIKKKYKEEVTENTLIKAAKEAIEEYELILISYSTVEFYPPPEGKKNKKIVNRLEDLLRITLEPLNTFKHKRVPEGVDMVADYLAI